MNLNNSNLKFSSDLPYPEINAGEVNCNYAKEMLDNIGGFNSEMSAISLYFYNNLITSKYPQISYAFHKVSIVEMHHLEIFGKLAFQLGENPKLWTQNECYKIYWTPAYNNYPNNLKELLLNSLNGEKAAIEKYRTQLEVIKNHNIQENLKRIISDEEKHIQIFEMLYKEYVRY